MERTTNSALRLHHMLLALRDASRDGRPIRQVLGEVFGLPPDDDLALRRRLLAVDDLFVQSEAAMRSIPGPAAHRSLTTRRVERNGGSRMPAPKQEPPAASDAFRETFAALFPHTSLQHNLGLLLAELAEFAATLPALEPPGEVTQMETALRAAAADLRYLERFLSTLGRKASDRKLTPTDRQLARGAGRVVIRLGAAAQTIDEMVDAAQTARRAEAG